MGRPIDQVIDKMLVHVPPDEELFSRLEWLKKDSRYKAPEQQFDCWLSGAEILQQEMPDPSELNEWQQKVVDIWMDKAKGDEAKTSRE